jgi:hypothetical protein
MNASTSKSGLSREERRSGKRGRTFKSAKLVFGGFSPTVIDCLVIEMSDVGVRVETGVMVQVPEILSLQLSDNTVRQVRRAWATGNEIGLEILPPTNG